MQLLQDWGVNLGICANGKRMVAMVKAYGQALQKVRKRASLRFSGHVSPASTSPTVEARMGLRFPLSTLR